MNRIWLFMPWFPYNIGLEALAKHCSFLNGKELYESWPRAGQFISNEFPVAKLKLTIDDFFVDCFMWESYTLISEKMRDVMALNYSEIQFMNVDSSESSASVRSMNYKILHVPVTDILADLQKSACSWGSLTGDGPSIPLSVDSISISPDAKPAHELFHDQNFIGHLFCTEDFALLVLKAECSGVRFVDPSQLTISRPMRFRTLRGIEESGEWNPVEKIEYTKIIQAIN